MLTDDYAWLQYYHCIVATGIYFLHDIFSWNSSISQLHNQ